MERNVILFVTTAAFLPRACVPAQRCVAITESHLLSIIDLWRL